MVISNYQTYFMFVKHFILSLEMFHRNAQHAKIITKLFRHSNYQFCELIIQSKNAVYATLTVLYSLIESADPKLWLTKQAWPKFTIVCHASCLVAHELSWMSKIYNWLTTFSLEQLQVALEWPWLNCSTTIHYLWLLKLISTSMFWIFVK